jgi:tetratricopeptide (TPR) repeat protein
MNFRRWKAGTPRIVFCLAVLLAAALGAAPSLARPPNADSPEARSAAQKDYQLGAAALKSHDYKTAIGKFKSALVALPDDAAINYALGIAYVGDDDINLAGHPLEHALEGQNPPPDTYLQLGLVYLKLDDRSKAEGVQKSLSDVIAKCDASCGDQRRDQLQAAQDSLTRALGQGAAPASGGKPTGWNFPDEKTGRADYAEAIGLINHRRYEEALVALSRAEEAVGPNPDIFDYMGFANRHLKRYDTAIAFYRQALALDPNHVGATEYLGELFLELGRTSEAKQQLAKLDELCPYGCAAREELARWMATAEK